MHRTPRGHAVIIVKTCVEIRCDRDPCEDGGWGNEDSGVPHFDSETEAVDYATKSGFLIAAGSVLCAAHARESACLILGHKWEDWGTELVHKAGINFRVRYCDHCNVANYDPPFEHLTAVIEAQTIVDQADRS
jgi:hypothetical protein